MNAINKLYFKCTMGTRRQQIIWDTDLLDDGELFVEILVKLNKLEIDSLKRLAAF
jgi:hypothetical protein